MEKGIPVLIIFMHLLSVPLATSTPNIITDQSALLSLKARITSDPYGSLQDWNISSSPVCNWTGVTCGSRHLRVMALNFSDMELAGEIPPELGNLSFLVSLDIRRNYFTGLIPQEPSHLPRLRFLRLGYNRLMGSIPHSIFNISTLETINFTNNTLSGILPEKLCIGLPILKNLLSHNEIHGQIPLNFTEYCSQLQILSLSHNFSGTTQPTIGKLGMLEELYLGGNAISDTIPSEIGLLRSLQLLAMEINMFEGPIPPSLFNLSSLQFLVMIRNELT